MEEELEGKEVVRAVPNADDHPWTTKRMGAAFGLAAVFCGIGIAVMTAQVVIGLIICIIGSLSIIALYYKELVSVRVLHRQKNGTYKPMGIELGLVIMLIAVSLIAPCAIYFHQQESNVSTIPPPAQQPILSPPQERLLGLINKYQRQFATKKLIVGLDGIIAFVKDPKTGGDINLVHEMYGSVDQEKLNNFGDLMESMPPKYLRFFPEALLGSPFVVGITEAGQAYLRTSR
jgi:hypothetical protein